MCRLGLWPQINRERESRLTVPLRLVPPSAMASAVRAAASSLGSTPSPRGSKIGGASSPIASTASFISVACSWWGEVKVHMNRVKVHVTRGLNKQVLQWDWLVSCSADTLVLSEHHSGWLSVHVWEVWENVHVAENSEDSNKVLQIERLDECVVLYKPETQVYILCIVHRCLCVLDNYQSVSYMHNDCTYSTLHYIQYSLYNVHCLQCDRVHTITTYDMCTLWALG